MAADKALNDADYSYMEYMCVCTSGRKDIRRKLRPETRLTGQFLFSFSSFRFEQFNDVVWFRSPTQNRYALRSDARTRPFLIGAAKPRKLDL